MLRRLLHLPAASSAAVVPMKLLVAPSIQPSTLPQIQHFQTLFRRHFIDLYKLVDKEAVKKEKDRINDELSRGYFADMSEFRKNDGKIGLANETLIPFVMAAKFPDIMVYSSDGCCFKLPLTEQNINGNNIDFIPPASLLCLSFRASSQRMIESWSAPFMEAFDASTTVQVFEVSFIDSWLLSRNPIKNLFLRISKSSNDPRRRFVYSFGDHYDLRKKLQVLNLLTGYIFLIDKQGRIRWQGFGSATQEEASSLISCTASLLLE